MKSLVLTNLKEFWPRDEKEERDSVYLGGWCFVDHFKYKFWDQRKFEVAGSPFKNWDTLIGANNYIEELSDRLLIALSKYSNKKSNMQNSEQYWRIVFSSWLIFWLMNVYDRYLRLEQLIKSDSTQIFKVRLPFSRQMNISYLNFIENFYENKYNIFVFSDIIRNSYLKNSFLIEEIETNIHFVNGDLDLGFRNGLKRKGISLINYSFRKLIKFNSYIESLYLYLQLIFDLSSTLEIKKINFTSNEKEPELEFEPTNDFESVIARIIKDYIPNDLIGFQVDNTLGRKICVGSIYGYKSIFNIAECIDSGGRWIATQHGGGYGHSLTLPQALIEIKNSYKFITWGWHYHDKYKEKYIPLPSPRLSILGKTKRQSKNNSLLFVSTMHPSFYYKLESSVLSDYLLSYMEDEKTFLMQLSSNVLKNTLYRDYTDYGQNILEYLSNLIDKDRVVSSGKLTEYLNRSKLVVIDHMATSFMESFVLNTPTILFWNQEGIKIRNEAKPFFDLLNRVGILHYTPQSAAKKVNEIWDYVDEWWNLPDVQKAKEDFCSIYASVSKDSRKKIMQFLNNTLLTAKTS